MTKPFLVWEKMHRIWLCTRSLLNIPIYENYEECGLDRSSDLLSFSLVPKELMAENTRWRNEIHLHLSSCFEFKFGLVFCFNEKKNKGVVTVHYQNCAEVGLDSDMIAKIVVCHPFFCTCIFFISRVGKRVHDGRWGEALEVIERV